MSYFHGIFNGKYAMNLSKIFLMASVAFASAPHAAAQKQDMQPASPSSTTRQCEFPKHIPAVNPQTKNVCVNVTDPKFGATADDNTDDTFAIEQAIAAAEAKGGGTVWIPAGTYMINAVQNICLRNTDPCGIKVPSNITLHLSKQAILKAIPNHSERYSIFTFQESKNAALIGGILVGERHAHEQNIRNEKVKKGQWGHGVQLVSARNVLIEDVTARDFWGDGFEVLDSQRQHISKKAKIQTADLTFRRITADGNRRQGLSILDGKNILIEDSVFKNTHGHLPEAGIDIEPENSETVDTLIIRNSKFINNSGGGIYAVVHAPFKDVEKSVRLMQDRTKRRAIKNLTIENNHVLGNRIGIVLRSTSGHRVTGNVIYSADPNYNFIIEENPVGLRVAENSAENNIVTDNTLIGGEIIDTTEKKNNEIKNNRLQARPDEVRKARFDSTGKRTRLVRKFAHSHAAGTTNLCVPTPTSEHTVNVNEAGAIADDGKDDTQAIQAAIDRIAETGGTVRIPEGTYHINTETGLNMRDNVHLRLTPQTVLEAIPNRLEQHSLIRFHSVRHAYLSGGKIKGDRNYDNVLALGSAVSIENAENIGIENLHVDSIRGDAFVLGSGSSAVRLCKVGTDNVQRNGVLITDAEDIAITDSVFKNANGNEFEQQHGILIKPHEQEFARNITIKANRFVNNRNYGIRLAGSAKGTNLNGVTLDKNEFISNQGMIFVSHASGNTITRNYARNRGNIILGNLAVDNFVNKNAALGGVIEDKTNRNRITRTLTDSLKSGVKCNIIVGDCNRDGLGLDEDYSLHK